MKVFCFDLDDTLYKEIDYLKSAYKEIAAYAVRCRYPEHQDTDDAQTTAYREMFKAYRERRDAFEHLNDVLGLHLNKSLYLNLYRSHRPCIQLSQETRHTLEVLMASGCKLGIITDGRSLQQRNKIVALGLHRYFQEDDIVISEEFGSEKPAKLNYQFFMRKYPEAVQFIYVGDNPRKDFIAPNQMGWTTIGLRGNEENIHIVPESVQQEYMPRIWVNKFSQILIKNNMA